MSSCKHGRRPGALVQRGLSLIVVLLILIVVSVLGVAGVNIAMMAERGTRNDRDMQLALQGAEAALTDAELDIEGVVVNPDATLLANRNARTAIFTPDAVNISQFVEHCGNTNVNRGLCTERTTGDKPAWLEEPNFDLTGKGVGNSVELGEFTGRPTLSAGTAGMQPAKQPRYVIEAILDNHAPKTCKTHDNAASGGTGAIGCPYLFRVTAMGFGPNPQTQVVLQMLYRSSGGRVAGSN